MEAEGNTDIGQAAPPPAPAMDGGSAPPPASGADGGPPSQEAAPAPAPANPSASVWDTMEPELRGWYEARGNNRENFDISEIAKQRREVETLVGRKGVVLPKDEGDDDGWENVWRELGVPKDPAGYTFLQSDDAAQQEQNMRIAQIYHNARLTPRQARAVAEASAALAQEHQDTASRQSEEADSKFEASIETGKKELLEEWGSQYDAKDEAAGKAISVLELDDAAIRQIARVAGWKQTMRTLAAIGGATAEANFHGSTGGNSAPMPSSADTAKAKISELSADPAFTAKLQSNDPSVRKLAVEEWERLHRMAHGGA